MSRTKSWSKNSSTLEKLLIIALIIAIFPIWLTISLAMDKK